MAIAAFLTKYAVIARHLANFGFAAGQESPALLVTTQCIGIFFEHLGPICLGVHRHRHEKNLGTEILPKRVLHGHHRRCQERAGIRALGVGKTNGDDLAPGLLQAEGFPGLCDQFEISGWSYHGQALVGVVDVMRKRTSRYGSQHDK